MLYEAIKQLFPAAEAGTDFTLRDDGEGPFIATWNLAAAKPTAAQLLVAGKAALLQALCKGIDQAADAARASVAGDPLRAEEYKLAAAEAQAFKDAGYPVGAVPRTVAAWAVGGRTAQQAADNILAEANAYTDAMYRIREARLSAKEQVRALMAAGNEVQASALASATIAAIKSAATGIGNNTGDQA